MEIWLDSVQAESIKLGARLGVLHGITTNPSIIKESGKKLEEILESLLQIQRGPVAVQVTANSATSMIEQADALREFSERIIVKIPVTQEGLKAISSLSHLQIPAMATAVFTPIQALLAARSGAHYIACYLSHMQEQSESMEEELKLMKDLIHNYKFKSKLLAASLKNFDQINLALRLGLSAITLQQELFAEMTQDFSPTVQCIKKFDEDWKKSTPSRLLPFKNDLKARVAS